MKTGRNSHFGVDFTKETNNYAFFVVVVVNYYVKSLMYKLIVLLNKVCINKNTIKMNTNA